ncbi:nitroreductase family protein [Brachybacterium phenoliresistens]|uniref:nitroreductase family protein n=1 Tax=Brachybacterium phenoliresistens TaxID=396014 RepID=UPI0031DE4FBE
MSTCEVPAVPELHPALERRFSPVRFDLEAAVTSEHVDTLLEAARRAPSAGSSQPWMFIAGIRGDDVHARLLPHLARSSSQWAPSASLLMVNLAQVQVEGEPEWEYSEFARYDLGQAVAHMTVQGLSIGLDAHQFRAFDRQAIEAEFAVPTHWEATSMTAFGVADHLPGEIRAAGTSRERAGRDDIVWARGRVLSGIGPTSAPRADSAAVTGGIFNDRLGLDPS